MNARCRRRGALAALTALALVSCRQDRVLSEAAKFGDLQANLETATAAVAAEPPRICERRDALERSVIPLSPATVDARLARTKYPTDCVSNKALATALSSSLGIIDAYGKVLVRAASGRKIPDPKIGGLLAAFNAANPKGAILPKVKGADIDSIVTGLETLLDRNLRANQIVHVVKDVDKPLAAVTDGLVPVFSDTAHCDVSATTWCALFDEETQRLKKTWDAIAVSTHSTPEPSPSPAPSRRPGALRAHPPDYFVAEWELQRRFEQDVKAHEDGVQLGVAYAEALRAFQKEHAALRVLIEQRSTDSTALFDR